MRIYVEPPGHLSRAMFRVSRALEAYVPAWATVVKKRADADLVLEHVIGADAIDAIPDKPFIVLQYCIGPEHPGFSPTQWKPYWDRAELVWSYYDLSRFIPPDRFFYSPLGIDSAFLAPWNNEPKRIGVITSGYVSGPGAEAIEEVWHAAHVTGLSSMHIGPEPTRLQKPIPPSVGFRHGISDLGLSGLYQSAQWVSGLRHVEGFELPALEGLVSGARPILFDRVEMRQWYSGHGVFVPECSGDALIERLIDVFRQKPNPIYPTERTLVADTFNWGLILRRLWTSFELRLMHTAWEQSSHEKASLDR